MLKMYLLYEAIGQVFGFLFLFPELMETWQFALEQVV